jgi:hypothetical protein
VVGHGVDSLRDGCVKDSGVEGEGRATAATLGEDAGGNNIVTAGPRRRLHYRYRFGIVSAAQAREPEGRDAGR